MWTKADTATTSTARLLVTPQSQVYGSETLQDHPGVIKTAHRQGWLASCFTVQGTP